MSSMSSLMDACNRLLGEIYHYLIVVYSSHIGLTLIVFYWESVCFIAILRQIRCLEVLNLNPEVLTKSPYHLRAIICTNIYLGCSRPDITFSASPLSRILHAPASRHIGFAKPLRRYVAGTKPFGLYFPSLIPTTVHSLTAAVDVDWAGYKHSRRSTTAYIFSINGAPIFWKSSRQSIIALSTAEAGYVILSPCAKDVLWLRRLVHEMVLQIVWNEFISIHHTLLKVESSTATSITFVPSFIKLA